MAKRAADTVLVLSSGEDNQSPPPRKRAARPPKTPRTPKAPKLPAPLYKASVDSLAETGSDRFAASATADIDNAVIAKIKKCLDRANHPKTPENEAKAAFYLASREMRKFNVTQAQVLAHERPSVQQQHAGQSIVLLLRTDGDRDKDVKEQSWMGEVAIAMETFFDCKYYTVQGRSSIRWTFYGIAENTVAAAMVFESASNLIAEWARSHRGSGPKNSYCLGASEELGRMAGKDKEAEEQRAKQEEQRALAARELQEEAERQAQLD